MLLVILLGAFTLNLAEAAEEDLPWEVKQHIQKQAITCNNQLKSEVVVV